MPRTKPGTNYIPHTKHGLCKHPLYKVWDHMKQRCYNPNSVGFRYWGAKGVRICPEWRYDFKPFYEWAIANGWEKGLQIDKDIKAKALGLQPLLYSPERCQFVTPVVNSRGRDKTVRFEYDGKNLCVSEWAEILSIPVSTIWQRYIRGKSIPEILNTKYTPKPKTKKSC